jgi:ribonucleoside-diphosphate reductase alpha chain
MDSFATAISMALQHGVPLKVLVEKFAHTRFEPSGWTGSEELGYAKSIMDYLFRWMQLRFLSGQQLDLFAGLKRSALAHSVISTEAQRSADTSASASTHLSGTMDSPTMHELHSDAFDGNVAVPDLLAGWGENDRTPPAQGIAPDLAASNGLSAGSSPKGSDPLSLEDRSLYHTASAMKAMYNMGDAPSCSTCGSIMTRNGSCYRCMECGSTSGCS